MFLTTQQSHLLSKAVKLLAEPMDERTLRIQIGETMLRLMKADYFASYYWDETERSFVNGVALNMSDDNISTYREYYQYHDPITPALQKRQVATRVAQIVPQKELVKTEYFNDFLWRDGLYWGMSSFATIDGDRTGDMRIWRGRNTSSFDDTELALLQILTPAFGAALKRTHVHSVIEIASVAQSNEEWREAKLTEREEQIARLAAEGLPDKEIARRLDIAFTTVRTHLEHAFRKLEVANRVQLAGMFR